MKPCIDVFDDNQQTQNNPEFLLSQWSLTFCLVFACCSELHLFQAKNKEECILWFSFREIHKHILKKQELQPLAACKHHVSTKPILKEGSWARHNEVHVSRQAVSRSLWISNGACIYDVWFFSSVCTSVNDPSSHFKCSMFLEFQSLGRFTIISWKKKKS